MTIPLADLGNYASLPLGTEALFTRGRAAILAAAFPHRSRTRATGVVFEGSTESGTFATGTTAYASRGGTADAFVIPSISGASVDRKGTTVVGKGAVAANSFLGGWIAVTANGAGRRFTEKEKLGG